MSIRNNFVKEISEEESGKPFSFILRALSGSHKGFEDIILAANSRNEMEKVTATLLNYCMY
jgi:hypothetical protein